MLNNLKFAFIFLLIQLVAQAQQTAVYTNHLSEFEKAQDLYKREQFLAAQSLFSKIAEGSDDPTLAGNSSFYTAMCAIHLDQEKAAKLMERFLEKYPTSIRRNAAYLHLGHFYFDNEKYTHARKWYQKVDQLDLNKAEREKFNFNLGYVAFHMKDNPEAREYFADLLESPSYSVPSKYYLGYMAYEEGEFETANTYFEEIKDDERYAGNLSYYRADMSFKMGKFEKAIEMGLALYETAESKERSELSKIIGESYFNLEQYEQAIPYLTAYKGKEGKWNNTDYYQLGYAHYKQRDYQSAVDEFNKIIDGNNEVSQNAFYHLAESYLNLDQKQQALNAFRNASEMNFDLKIKEDAWLNYAKLSYEIGNSYESVTEVLSSFIEAYPDNPNNDELRDLLIDSYITSKNYGAALELLENNDLFENPEAYQKVAFFRGIELYNESEYRDAIDHFDKSLAHPLDANIAARSVYWKAECNYNLSNFNESLTGMKQFLQLSAAKNTPEYKNSSYNLAYNYFSIKSYSEAIPHFRKYVNSRTASAARKQDAYLRLGDCFFVSSEYWAALENYDRAIELGSHSTDYAVFQKAISYGFVDRTPKKIEDLKNFGTRFPKSIYRDEALFELGNTYGSMGNNELAVASYNKLLSEHPGSGYVARSMLRKALIMDNTGKSGEALSIYRDVVRDFPSTPESVQAVASAKLIYIDQGRVDEYARWVRSLDFVEVGDTELDDAAYSAAERPYLENNEEEAINRFEDYLEQFPNGKRAMQVHLYLAQMYFGKEERNKAIRHYGYIADRERNEYTEEALARVSELYLLNEDYEKALSYLQRLEDAADFEQNKIFAQSNIMKASYELKQYELAVHYAEKVIENGKIDNRIKGDARVIVARSAMKTGDMAKARTAYAAVKNSATGKLAAEALYFDAYFKHMDGAFEQSNNSVQKLAKDYPGYKLYGAKGLLLMAKNFYALDDAYQANYILESIIANFTDFPEIVEEAKDELANLKAAEAETNSSVETKGN